MTMHPKPPLRMCAKITIARVIMLLGLAVAPTVAATGGAELPVEYWDLPTGSRIGGVKIATSVPPASAQTLVLVHGGPGACQVYSYGFARSWYERLAALGFDVYLYDQIGGGVSDRLSDPRDYTLARHLADLEAIRQRIGCERMTLIGESWGATLAAHYIARHPQRVERAIFLSPGVIEPAEWKRTIYPYATPRVTAEFLDWIARTRGRDALKRYARLDALLQRGDVCAAHDFAGDAEMDALMDAYVEERILRTCVHDPTKLAERSFAIPGMGWWASLMTSWSAVNSDEGVRARLAGCDVPVLVIRGESDYLPVEAAAQYVRTFRVSTVVRVPAAGHFIWMDQPERFRTEILAFLRPRSERAEAQPARPAPPPAS